MHNTVKTCSVPGCEDKHQAKGYCQKHYLRVRRNGTIQLKKQPKPCKDKHCEKKSVSLGYCQTHYMQIRRNTYLEGKEINRKNETTCCKVENCSEKTWSKQYCYTHYNLSRRHKFDLSRAKLEKCQVCGSLEKLNIDHDHSCCPKGRSCERCFRGVLCNKCNLALGLLQDNEENILNLLKYIKS